MPTFIHEAVAELARDFPRLVFEVLRRCGLVVLPSHDAVVADATDLGAALPHELRADCVLRCDRGGEPVLAAVVEVQLAPKPDKAFAWPAYVSSLRRRLKCDVILVVVTVDRATADWARRPIVLGPGTGHVQALVLGPDEIPAITDETEALAAPELAVLSALAHGQDEDIDRAVAIVEAASRAVLTSMEDAGTLYYDRIWAALSGPARKAFEMLPRNYEYQNPGLRQAKAEGKADSLVKLLEARGLAMTDIDRARILACTDLAQLDRWLRAAVSAASVDDVLAP